MNIEEKVKAYIERERLIGEGDRILLGLSGGADSVCLFYILLALREEFGFALRAVHVHHGIRREAEGDASYVRDLCEREGVSCCVFREDVPAYAERSGLSEEEAGRLLRYQDFRKYLENWREEDGGSVLRYRIATAHHGNDQAETVLFQLFRGCGLSGLRGILPERDDIIRPMLCLSKGEIEAYLRKKGISWCEDKTNESEAYSRNRVRRQILPLADEICPGAVSHIGKTAEIVREAESYIRRQMEGAYIRISSEHKGYIVFDINILLKEDIFLQKQLILYGLGKISPGRRDIGMVHVEDILKLARKQGNGTLCLPGRVRVRKSYRELAFFRKDEKDGGGEEKALRAGILSGGGGFLFGDAVPGFEAEQISLMDEKAVKERLGIRKISEIMECIPQKTYTKWFDYDKIETSSAIRHPVSGDFLTIDRELNRKDFRRYMIEVKIPVSLRDRIWIFADGAHVMWAPGGRMSSHYKVTEQTKTILQIKICAEE